MRKCLRAVSTLSLDRAEYLLEDSLLHGRSAEVIKPRAETSMPLETLYSAALKFERHCQVDARNARTLKMTDISFLSHFPMLKSLILFYNGNT